VSAGGEKSFDPTPQRIERAKREGDVARSAELATNVGFASAALTVVAILPWFDAASRSALVAAPSGRVPWLQTCATLAWALVPAGSAAAAAILASIVQTGGLRVGSIGIKLERCNPLDGLKRIASRETCAHAFRAVIACAIAGAAMLAVAADTAARVVAASTVAAAVAGAWRGAERVASAAVATGLLFALTQHAAARSAWLRRLRMSADERKREAKEQEGDPFARGRRRALHRSLARGAIAEVKSASFVVVNPTHVAVALTYRPPEIPVPVVVVRATGELALRVRDVAQRYEVAVVENPPLARALYRDARVGRPIAAAHYVTVAEIVIALRRNAEPRR